jgi:Ca-activated chloride channel family protein
MTSPLPTLTEEEFARCVPTPEEECPGALCTERGHLPLRALDVQARIDGLLVHVNVRQRFQNPFDVPLEATYIFPLPDRAAVTRFRMETGGRVIDGVLRERGEARRRYDQALREGRKAAITEEERPGVFTVRVGNILPGEEATVELSLAGPLLYADGEATFRFPLVVAPRYIPGVPLPGMSVGDGVASDTDAVPDASRITPPVLLPGYPNPVQLSLCVDIESSALKPHDFRSSLHAVAEEDQEGMRRFRLKPGDRLNRDFVLRFRLGDHTVKTALTLAPDAGGEGGTFLLTIVPPATEGQGQRPRDVIFVLDRSGSMAGWKMVAARRAMARMVDTLGDADRFSVYAFANDVEQPPNFPRMVLVPASNRNRYQAVEFLARIEAVGGTEMAQPLGRALRELAMPDPQRDRVLVLVTDGQVGNEDQLLRTLASLVQGVRIFTLGIDRAVNEPFLRRLAQLGGGICEIVESEERLDKVMDKVHRRLGMPVLTGLDIKPQALAIEPDTRVPARVSDVFAGVPVLVLGRYRGKTQGAMRVQANDALGRSWSETVTAVVHDSPASATIWARGHIRELEDRYVQGHRELESQIVATSLKHNTLSRFTAFVAVDAAEVANPSGEVHRIIQPVEPAEGWTMLESAGVPAFDCFRESGRSARMSLTQADEEEALHRESGLYSLPASQPSALPPPTQPAAPMPPATPPRAAGIARGFRWPKIRLSRRKQTPTSVPSPSPVDFTAYHFRARGLLDELRRAAGANAADLLRAWTLRLGQLVEDLGAIGFPPELLQAMTQLLEQARAWLGKPTTEERELVQLRLVGEQVLEQFVGSIGSIEFGQPPIAVRRQDFWK